MKFFEDNDFFLKVRSIGPYLSLLSAAVLWGTTYPIVKIGLSVLSPPLPPLGYLFLRFTVALLVLIPILPMITSLDNIKSLLSNNLIILLGIVNGGSYILQFLGQKGTTAGMATLMINTYLISTPILASLYLNLKITRKLRISIFLGILGVTISALSVIAADVPPGNIPYFLINTTVVLFSGLIWGGYSVISNEFFRVTRKRPLETSFHPITVFFVSNAYSVILIGVSMLILQQTPDFLNLSLKGWTSILYLGIACTSTTYILYIYASKSVSPAVLNVILLLNVIIGLILSRLLLGDNFSVFMILGSIIILLAIYLASGTEKS